VRYEITFPFVLGLSKDERRSDSALRQAQGERGIRSIWEVISSSFLTTFALTAHDTPPTLAVGAGGRAQ
jgi:hypothetical protein